jgi:hypothetical protein
VTQSGAPGEARVRAVTALPGHHSFGYYDKCPWDLSGRYLLALRAPFCDRSPEAEDVATLGLVDLHEGDRFRPFAETRAWNWQQGCMLHWLRAPFAASPAGGVPPGEGSLVVYNDRDGHCSYSPDEARRWIANDTYPDAEQRRTLYVFDTQTGRRTDLGRFYSPPELTQDFRVDLHPRWSRDGRQLCFDSAHEGSRQLYVADAPA